MDREGKDVMGKSEGEEKTGQDRTGQAFLYTRCLEKRTKQKSDRYDKMIMIMMMVIIVSIVYD